MAEKGDKFDPFEVEDRDPVVTDLPSSPLAIFQAFLPVKLLQEWADATNAHVAAIIDSNEPTPARLTKPVWVPVTTNEIYVFIGMVICMSNASETAITDYWRSYTPGSLHPIYPWTAHMPLRRFEALWRYIRFYDYSDFEPKKTSQKAYLRVEKWSRHIQETTTKFYTPGSKIAVDECMQQFAGRSDLRVTIPNKPTPEGIKIWSVGQDGILLRWLWHQPASGAVNLDPSTRKLEKTLKLTPTQRVVTNLVTSLPAANYHVYLDNLFSSPALFKRLRELGTGASGTCRINCGIHKDLVALKAKPGNMCEGLITN